MHQLSHYGNLKYQNMIQIKILPCIIFFIVHAFGKKIYHFYNEPLANTRISQTEKKMKPLIESGIDLNFTQNSKPIYELSICFNAELDYGKPSCLFDVAGIQFTFSHPENRFGQIRFTKEQDRTIIFNIGGKYEVWFFYLLFNTNSRTRQL